MLCRNLLAANEGPAYVCICVCVCVSKGNNLNCHETPQYITHSSNKRLVDRKNVNLKEHTAPFLEVAVNLLVMGEEC